MIVLRIIFIACIIIFGINTYLIFAKRPLKNKYRYNFNEDEVVKRNQLAQGYADFVYRNINSEKYITEYILSKRGNKKYVTFNYVNEMDKIEYVVEVYDQKKNIIKLIQVIDTNRERISKIIKLPKKTKFINVIVTTVNGEDVFLSPLKRVSMPRILFFGFLNYIEFVTFSFVLYWLVIEIFGSVIKDNYVLDNILFHTLFIAGSGIVYCVIIFLVTLLKNGYFKRKAGVLHNEF